MKSVFFVVPFAALMLAGCGKQEAMSGSPDSAVQHEVAPPPPTKPTYTADTWRRDFSSVFETSGSKTDEDGITKYQACFEPQETKPRCKLVFSGMKDGFRKVDHLTPPMTSYQELAVKYSKKGPGAYIDMRVVAPQCQEAAVVLNPKLFAKSWLFMDKVAFMADGDVVYEKVADPQSVKRDNEYGGIEESWSFRIESSDYSKLEKFVSAESKVVRVSGDKGYMTLSKDSVKVFSEDILSTIQAAKAINKVLAEGGGPICAS